MRNAQRRAALLGGTQLVKVPHATNWRAGDLNLYAIMFQYFFDGHSVLGTDFDAYWTFARGGKAFPNGPVTIHWKKPTDPVINGVAGYHAVGVGNANGNGYSFADGGPLIIADVQSAYVDYDFSYTGSPNWNFLAEVWLTRKAQPTQQLNGGAETTREVGWMPYTGSTDFNVNQSTLIDFWTDPDGLQWRVAISLGVYVTCIPWAAGAYVDRMSGRFYMKEYWLWLAERGVITGSEWVNGYYSSGMEPFQGSLPAEGTVTFKKYTPVFTRKATAANVDYFLSTNFIPSTDEDSFTNWNLETSGTTVGGQADMNGGTSAIFLPEVAAAQNHGPFKLSVPVPSRQMDFVWMEDVKASKGRTKIQMGVDSTDFTNQLQCTYDLTALTSVQDGQLAGITLIRKDAIDLGNGWTRIILRFRKAAGINALFMSLLYNNGTGTQNYLGDVTKGMIFRPRHRLFQDVAISVSGAPATTGTQGAAYTFTPTLVGGADPVVWSKTGTLPTGATQDTTTGVVSGTLSASGTFAGITLTATDAGGRTASIGPFSVTVSAAVAPANTVLPLMTNPSVQQGVVVQGQVLSCSTGTWSGSPTPTYAYQWKRAGAAISGATASTYTVQAADDGSAITCTVTATNAAGSASATTVLAPVAIAGTVRLNEAFNSQNTWVSTGNYAWTGGKLVVTNSGSFNASTRPITMTAGKTMRCIYDLAPVDTSDAFAIILSGTTTPAGTQRNTTGTFTDNIVAPASPTAVGLQTRAAACSGSLDNLLVVELP